MKGRGLGFVFVPAAARGGRRGVKSHNYFSVMFYSLPGSRFSPREPGCRRSINKVDLTSTPPLMPSAVLPQKSSLRNNILHHHELSLLLLSATSSCCHRSVRILPSFLHPSFPLLTALGALRCTNVPRFLPRSKRIMYPLPPLPSLSPRPSFSSPSFPCCLRSPLRFKVRQVDKVQRMIS